MTDEQEAPDDGLSVDSIRRMIECQIAQTYDAPRMQKAWENILGGATPPKVIASALVQALSGGRYERSRPQVVTTLNVYVSGVAEPERIRDEVARAITLAPNA